MGVNDTSRHGRHGPRPTGVVRAGCAAGTFQRRGAVLANARTTALSVPPIRTRRGKIELWLNLVIFIISLAAIAGSVLFFAHRPALRLEVDATKTRAYSLSEQTRHLLENLEGDWRISLVFVRDEIDRDVLRQMEEVLSRYDDASEHLSVEQIDPTDAGALSQYDALLARLRAVSPEEVAKYEHHLDAATERYRAISSFAEREAALVQSELRAFSAGDATAGSLRTVHQSFTVLAKNAGQILELAEGALEQSDAQAIPDYEKARDTLVAALTAAARDLAILADTYRDWMAGTGVSAEFRAYLARAARRFDGVATELQTLADPLIHLRPLQLTDIARELAHGEAAIITGPGKAGVIPAAQLLPRANLRQTREGGVSFDQRFRGEQLLSSALRSLQVEQMPMVIFVHARSESLLTPRDKRLDLFGVASVLKSARYDVREWSIVQDEPPTPEEGQPAVWIIVPQPFAERISRAALETPREELALIETAQRLLDSGESVLLPFYPSTLHRFKQPDPWLTLLNGWGIKADTARILSHKEVGEGGESGIARNLDLTTLSADHPISLAGSGQTMHLNLPVALETGDVPRGTSVQPVVRFHPDDREHWLEEEWTRQRDVSEEPDEPVLDDAVTLAVAAGRARPRAQGAQEEQRLLVVGSVDWMLSAVADFVIQLGGGRVALLYPGNIEFMQAAVAWLAGMDELIAQSPTSQQVARIDALSPASRRTWGWLVIGAMPVACLIFGTGIWFVRRR